MQLHWLPNVISAVRIALVPFIVLAIFRAQFGQAFGLFFVAGFSDALDGFLARRFNWHSRLGSLLDPLADKLMMIGVFATLAITGLTPVWLAALVILRDVIIIGGATVYNFMINRLNGAATLLSKVNTGVIGLYVLSVLARHAFGVPGEMTSSVLAIVAAATVVASGTHYVLSWSRRASRDAHE